MVKYGNGKLYEKRVEGRFGGRRGKQSDWLTKTGTLEARMSTSNELEILDQLLDNGRKVHKYIDELAVEQPSEAKKVKERLNSLCDRALAIYFYETEKQNEFQRLLNEVKDLLEDGKRGQLVA